MVVYAFDGNNPPVKIVKRGKTWNVYRLERVRVKTSYGYRRGAFLSRPPFGSWVSVKELVWSKSPIKKWSYRPYEDDDVDEKPNKERIYHHVARWQPNMIELILG